MHFGDAAGTILVLQQGESGKVGCTGAAWIVIGTPTEGGSDFSAAGIAADVVAESTAAAGVTVDGLLIKDGDAVFVDSDKAIFGTGLDVTMAWDGTDFDVLGVADDQVIKVGNGTNSFDAWVYGNVATDYVLWDASASLLSLAGVAKLGVANRSIGASTVAVGTNTGTAGALPAGTAPVYPTTAADDTVGVVIHASDKVTGRQIFIGNGVSNKILKVYPAAGGTINGAAADAAFSSVSGKGVIVVCLDSTANTWLAW